MANFTKFTRKRLGEILVNEGLITTGQIQEALEAQGNTGEMLGETLVRLGYITEEKIASTLADQFQLPFIDASNYDIDKGMSKMIPVQYMLDHLFVPLDTFGNVLVIAIAGLLTDDVINEIRERTNSEVFVYISTMGDVRKALEKMYPELFQLGPAATQVAGIGYTEAIEHTDEDALDGFDSAEAALDAILPEGEAAPAAPTPPPRAKPPAPSPAPARGKKPAAAGKGRNSGNNNHGKGKAAKRGGARPASQPASAGGEEEDDTWESLFDEADESVRKDLGDG